MTTWQDEAMALMTTLWEGPEEGAEPFLDGGLSEPRLPSLPPTEGEAKGHADGPHHGPGPAGCPAEAAHQGAGSHSRPAVGPTAVPSANPRGPTGIGVQAHGHPDVAADGLDVDCVVRWRSGGDGDHAHGGG